MRVDDATAPFILQVEDVQGDFPLLLRISASGQYGETALEHLEDLVRTMSHELDAAVIVDSFGVEPAFDDEWLLVTPHGDTAVVHADIAGLTSADPVVVLVPESRALYSTLMHRQLAATG